MQMISSVDEVLCPATATCLNASQQSCVNVGSKSSDTGYSAKSFLPKDWLPDYITFFSAIITNPTLLYCCSGQNKNNFIMQYMCWRVLVGLHDEIEFNFSVAGHTKFSCDLCFGLIKKRYRRTRVSSLQDLVNVSKLFECKLIFQTALMMSSLVYYLNKLVRKQSVETKCFTN